MGQRVMIFSEERRDKDGLVEAVDSYLLENFSSDHQNRTIEIQTFSSIPESSEKETNKIGAGGEILIIMDRKLNPKNEYVRRKYSVIDQLCAASFEMSENICDEKKIPLLIYQGELVKYGPRGFDGKLKFKSKEVKERKMELENLNLQ